ncbi:hypothetical protein PR202_ga22807 [Eleusine coracana subsp. coracana]|uniref:Reverse transcriptase zinc-binding domain-containing protein n=1 Tax=Eleusine coracana subsp. coracana TaxID=191504 RepID=A0AAV5D4W5_ELECO|nr:hypothetical protein PR202_ga22807 [Eleusine coracana subsp. coracana]
MHLDSYVCELCILQREESLHHLFIKCNFAKSCWQTIGISYPSTLSRVRIIKRIKRHLQVPFYIKTIILMSWCIWKQRNGWLFNNNDPSVQECLRNFKLEFFMVIHREKSSILPQMQQWLGCL